MARVRAEGVDLAQEAEAGTLVNPQANVGLEYETYGVDEENWILQRPSASYEFNGNT